ncbi:MAG TPA: glutamate-1-semialdehyde 2,1-aminomutase, partial [Flavobacterium sp.]|nr:glutamate-1-semialdehyde 2,1-aminomutase [Flavobacterium sp.]
VTFGSPNSPGVTEGTAKDTLLAKYNDLENVKTLIEANKNEIAAIIIEPVAGNMGCIPPQKGFLQGLRDLCTANGILLIFDEVMTGFRLARGFTKRDKIIKFAGCYHGHSDSLLIQAGSGAVTFGSPNSPGVTEGTAKDTLLAKYNDLENVKTLIEANKNEIAAIIIEPVAGNMGCIPPQKGFLQGLRDLCTANGILLIFDEVMTGFRLARGGVQELYNINADIVTFGKVIGGGLPVGAFAARAEIMNYLAPLGPVYQAGTLSGNPLAMAAGLAMLQSLDNDRAIFTRLEEKTAYLEAGIDKVLKANNVVFTINRVGSMISVHFDENPVVDFQTAAKGDNETFKKFFHGLLNEGVYIAPSAYETWFITDALTYEDLDFTINAINKVSKTF